MQTPPSTIADSIAQVRSRIAAAERRGERTPGSVRLLAVSKTRPVSDIFLAHAAGQTAFGESYLQEALDKIEATAALNCEWHFIGPLQSNKTRAVASHFDWVHSVDRLRIAQRLSEQRPSAMAPLQVCLQINISGEASKSGASEPEATDLAHQIAALPGLELRGLMAIPAPSEDFAAQRRACARLRHCLQRLRASGLALDTLSIGMSDDLEAAILEGSTIVRIGTAIFGARMRAP